MNADGYLPPDAFFAGFFDADGCVSISRKNGGPARPHFAFACQVSQVQREVLELFRRRFGGSVRGDGRTGWRTVASNPVYVWSVVSQDAENFLLAVLPYLVVKRERAELGLCFREAYKGDNVLPRRWFERPEVAAKHARIMALRTGICDQMQALNARGRNGVFPGAVPSMD